MKFTQSDIPSFLQSAGAEMVDQEQRIDTIIHEPVVVSDTFIRFEMQSSGLLNPKSRITFAMDTAVDSFYPLNVGVGSLIQRATLRIGGKTICEVEDWSHYFAYKSMFVDQEVNKQREQFNSGRCMSNSVEYDDDTLVSDSIGMDLGVEPINEADPTDTNTALLPFQNLANSGVFSLTLDQLVPCLAGVQLPLFMLKESVQLELTLSSAIGKRVCLPASASGSVAAAFPIDQSEVRMIADYTFLDGDAMNAFAAANKDFEYTFLEPRLTKTTLADAAAWGNQIRNVGGAGRRVPKMFVMVTSDKMGVNGSAAPTAGLNPLTLLNEYRGIAPYSGSEADGEYGQVIANIKKNDGFIFPIDRSNSALHYHGIQQTEGAVPHITRTQYARQGNSLSLSKFQSRTLSDDNEMSGQFFALAFRFPDGQRVDSRGLEMHLKYSGKNTLEAPFVQRTYIEMEKRFIIKDGIVDSVYE
tara:strand:- start:6807 stop:8216 length:1410 start_codon:yes stop_codon:yes gene_type:complete